MRIAAVMTVHNEADILPINIAYHRSIGIDDFWVIDNGSSDGTSKVPSSLAQRAPWLRWRSEPGAFRQSEFATDLAHRASLAGADWIVPIDADEFWWTANGTLGDVLAGTDAGALVCEVENFVQSGRVRQGRAAAPMTMTRRANPVGTVEDARRLVESSTIGFVEIRYPSKLIHRAAGDLVIGQGDHNGTGHEGGIETSTSATVLHAAIHSRARLDRLAEHGRRAILAGGDAGNSCHLRRWAKLSDEGTLDEDWRANSYRESTLRVDGRQHELAHDLRLRSSVSPFIPVVSGILGPLRSASSSQRLPLGAPKSEYRAEPDGTLVETSDGGQLAIGDKTMEDIHGPKRGVR